MGYSKQIAKQAKKLDLALELVRKRDYEAALRELNREYASPTLYSRYLKAFSLLKTGNSAEALAHWWPLVNDRRPLLERDCERVARQVFAQDQWLEEAQQNLPLTTLAALLEAALHFSIANRVTLKLERETLPRLFAEKRSDEIFRVLSAVGTLSVAKLRGEAKLALLAPRKSGYKPFEFASVILCAGASELVGRPTSTTAETELALGALGDEILLNFPARESGARIEDERATLDLFVHAELLALKEILSHRRDSPPGGLLLSPGGYYFNKYDASTLDAFREWLNQAPVDPELRALYDPKIYPSFLARLSGSAVKQAPPLTGWCWLELAGRFRSDGSGGLPAYSAYSSADFRPKPAAKSGVFLARLGARITLRGLLKVSEQDRVTQIPEAALTDLMTLARASGENELAEIAVDWALRQVTQEYLDEGPWLKSLRRLEQLLGPSRLSTYVNDLQTRTQICLAFLQTLIRKSAKGRLDIQALTQNEETFREHFALISDTILLAPPLLTARTAAAREQKGGTSPAVIPPAATFYAPFMRHLESFLRAGRELDLRLDRVVKDLDRCHCSHCLKGLYEDVPDLARVMGLPSLMNRINGDNLNSPTLRLLGERVQSTSRLGGEDPFAALGVSPDDPKQVVLSQVMRQMAARPQAMAELRRLQARTFEPDTRLLYLLFKGENLPSLFGDFDPEASEPTANAPVAAVELLSREQVQ